MFVTDFVTLPQEVDLAEIALFDSDTDPEYIANQIFSGNSQITEFDVYILLLGHHLASQGDCVFLWKYQRLLNALKLISPRCHIVVSSLLPYPDSQAHIRNCNRKNWVMKRQLVTSNTQVYYADVASKLSRFGKSIPLKFFDPSDLVLNSTHGWPRAVQIFGHKLAGLKQLEWRLV